MLIGAVALPPTSLRMNCDAARPPRRLELAAVPSGGVQPDFEQELGAAVAKEVDGSPLSSVELLATPLVAAAYEAGGLPPNPAESSELLATPLVAAAKLL